MRRVLALALLALVPALAAGCGGDSISDAGPTLSGRYALATFDGAPPPLVLLDGDPKVELLADEMVFTPNGSFVQHSTFRYTEAGTPTTVTDGDTGTFTVQGGVLTVRFASDPTPVTGRVMDGKSFSLTADGHTAVYRQP